MRLFLSLLTAAALAAGGYALWQWQFGADQAPSFRTATVERGDLVAAISATGTLEPEEVVDVGAQVAGRIDKFGDDLDKSGKPIDYRSRVEKGTPLAYIERELYEADVKSAAAELAVAEADVKRAEADLVAAEARFTQADRDYARARRLGVGPITRAEFERLVAMPDPDLFSLVVDPEATLEPDNALLARLRAFHSGTREPR